MPVVLTSLAIDASPRRVWEVLTDFDAYREWNPLIRAPRGRAVAGEPFDFRLALGPIAVPIAARVVRADGQELRWEGPRNRLQAPLGRGSHYFRLEPLGPDRTRLVHGEAFDGPLFGLSWRLVGPRLQEAYASLNRAIKARAEQSTAPSSRDA